MKREQIIKSLFKIITILATILIIVFIIYGMKLGIFRDKNILINYIKKFGLFGPIFFIFIQIVQVVFPVIPGGASCLAGVLAFGPIAGFIYNYLGLAIGSSIAYYLSKKYGLKLVRKLFNKETVDKYLGYIRVQKFDNIFFWGILLPGLPDDLLCYVAGLSEMSFKKFLAIIMIGKPLALIMYSVFVVIL